MPITSPDPDERVSPREMIYVGGWKNHPIYEGREVNTLSISYGGKNFFRRIELPEPYDWDKEEMIENAKDDLLSEVREYFGRDFHTS